jgi:AhpD family alkylhydroperoxidase
MSEHRIDYMTWKPGYDAMLGMERAVRRSDIERPLIELIKLRASQINQCAYCIDMHWKDARARGETEQRLYGLAAWRETSYYTDRERAALDLTEAVTLVADTHVPDDVIAAAEVEFTADQLAMLLFTIVTINAWNRLAISGRADAGSYSVATRA